MPTSNTENKNRVLQEEALLSKLKNILKIKDSGENTEENKDNSPRKTAFYFDRYFQTFPIGLN